MTGCLLETYYYFPTDDCIMSSISIRRYVPSHWNLKLSVERLRSMSCEARSHNNPNKCSYDSLPQCTHVQSGLHPCHRRAATTNTAGMLGQNVPTPYVFMYLALNCIQLADMINRVKTGATRVALLVAGCLVIVHTGIVFLGVCYLKCT